MTDAAKYVSVLLLSLRAMLHLELPHINVLSKVDLLTQYGDLGNIYIYHLLPTTLTHSLTTDFNLEFYTEVQDLTHLENALSSASPRYAALNMAICGLIEDFSLVGFETLAVEVRLCKFVCLHKNVRSAQTAPQDKQSMLNLMRAIDRATGYVFAAPAATPADAPNAHALPSSAMGPCVVGLRSDVRDVQERWVDAREEWDAYERVQWRREGEALRRAAEEVGVDDGGTQKRDIRIHERRGP